jgi:hypothetical protein
VENAMTGHNPHRPEGKAPDMEHMRRAHERDRPIHAPPQDAPLRPPSSYPAKEQIGGSRPGVPSRVKEAIASREERDGEA